MFSRHLGKERRDAIVERHIRALVASGRDHIVVDDLPFETALGYALDRGARAPERDSASTRLTIDGTSYFVVFTRATLGGTIIGAEGDRQVRERVMDPAKMQAHLFKGLTEAFAQFSEATRYETAERRIVKDIQDGVLKKPTWIRDEARLQDLLLAVRAAAVRGGMAEPLALLWLQQSDILAAVVTSAAEFEIAGFDLPGQIVQTGVFAEKLAKAQLRAEARRTA